ncbi:MAG: carbohydrate ABC transporter permease [Armatimonadetes bacterium]|nr:carbohydrate ABC transporter permease [Armatimonadota bacterium]
MPSGSWRVILRAKPIVRAAKLAVASVLAILLMAPFVWMLLVSLHESRSSIPVLRDLWPKEAHWENYRFVLLHPDVPVFRFLLNSLVVAGAVVAGQLLVCSMAAYGFARLRFRGREFLFSLFLGSMMFAGTVTQIPTFLLVRQLHWLDTYWALIVPGIGSAFGVFLLRQFFLQIPLEIDEAARIDGAGEWKVYWKVILPMSRAALATLGAFAFIATWTDFFWPLIATSSQDMRTLEVGLSIFKNSYNGQNWPLQMTAAVVTLVPVLAVFLLLQRHFVKGVTIGSIK